MHDAFPDKTPKVDLCLQVEVYQQPFICEANV